LQKSLQLVASLFLFTAIGLTQTSGKVNVTSPVSGSTVTSPVHYVASAQAPANRHITAMRIYVDYKSVYFVPAAKLDTYVTMTQGSHKVTVQAWDSSGSVYKKSLSLTVIATSPTPTPTPSPSPTPTPTPSPSPTPSGTNFYVSTGGSDSNSGSAASPWATIQHAANVAKAGSVIHVAPGTYTAALTTSISGTSSARIRFISDVKWGAKIVTSGAQYSWYNTANYIDIMGFDITGNSRDGINNGGSFVRIIGNHIHNIPAACTSSGGAGIVNSNYSASDDDVIGNVVHDIGTSLSTSCGTVQGIYHANLRGHIMNNIVYRVWSGGICLWHAASHVVIANNLVYQNGSDGILVGAGDAPGGVVASGMLVVNNMVIYNDSSWGNGYAIVEAGLTGTDNKYINNLIWNNKRGIVLQNGVVAIGTINADPLLVNYQPNGSGDYHLQSGSRAINSGTSTAAPSIDLDGAPRPFGTGFDIGVYEFGSTPKTWPWM